MLYLPLTMASQSLPDKVSHQNYIHCTFYQQKMCFSVVHTGNREFSCPHCTQRFGRKDHMTRHAKKTHANFYDSSERLERTRLISTPLPGEEEEELASRVAPSRKERSVSDPGPPLLISRELKVPSYSSKIEPLDEMTDCDQQMQSAQLPSQQKVIEEFEKL